MGKLVKADLDFVFRQLVALPPAFWLANPFRTRDETPLASHVWGQKMGEKNTLGPGTSRGRSAMHATACVAHAAWLDLPRRHLVKKTFFCAMLGFGLDTGSSGCRTRSVGPFFTLFL